MTSSFDKKVEQKGVSLRVVADSLVIPRDITNPACRIEISNLTNKVQERSIRSTLSSYDDWNEENSSKKDYGEEAKALSQSLTQELILKPQETIFLEIPSYLPTPEPLLSEDTLNISVTRKLHFLTKFIIGILVIVMLPVMLVSICCLRSATLGECFVASPLLIGIKLSEKVVKIHFKKSSVNMDLSPQ
ncbi:MAG: hypothetical protein GOP50_12660, partial [Candidatus Heimdallarchaeota archaeon]|nr:hypothetical protein [Candidatus Heimdallarchaeota archaeon]